MNSPSASPSPLPPSLSAFRSLLLFIAFVCICGIAISAVFAGIALWAGIDLTALERLDEDFSAHLTFFKWFQIISSIAFFVLPPLLFAAYIAHKNWKKYIGIQNAPESLPLLYCVGIAVLGFSAITLLFWLNQQLSLPAFMSDIENWMRSSETQAARLTEYFLHAEGIGDLLLNLLMVAVLPAVGEELVFRGTVQPLLQRTLNGNIHVAILLTAVIFSAIHFQFFGFLPRMFIGIWLGYLYYWSGNLWYPVAVHFINNGVQVLMTYWGGTEDLSASQNIEMSLQLFIGSALGSAGLAFFLWKFYQYFQQKNNNIGDANKMGKNMGE